MANAALPLGAVLLSMIGIPRIAKAEKWTATRNCEDVCMPLLYLCCSVRPTSMTRYWQKDPSPPSSRRLVPADCLQIHLKSPKDPRYLQTDSWPAVYVVLELPKRFDPSAFHPIRRYRSLEPEWLPAVQGAREERYSSPLHPTTHKDWNSTEG